VVLLEYSVIKWLVECLLIEYSSAMCSLCSWTRRAITCTIYMP